MLEPGGHQQPLRPSPLRTSDSAAAAAFDDRHGHFGSSAVDDMYMGEDDAVEDGDDDIYTDWNFMSNECHSEDGDDLDDGLQREVFAALPPHLMREEGSLWRPDVRTTKAPLEYFC